MKPTVRVALYARVSTFAGQNPEMQLCELREYCDRRGLKIVGAYVDKGISGSRERRPALDRLMADCRKRLVDASLSTATTGSPVACDSSSMPWRSFGL